MPSVEAAGETPKSPKGKFFIWGILACCILPVILLVAAIILLALGLIRVSVPTINPFNIFGNNPGSTSNQNGSGTNASGNCQTTATLGSAKIPDADSAAGISKSKNSRELHLSVVRNPHSGGDTPEEHKQATEWSKWCPNCGFQGMERGTGQGSFDIKIPITHERWYMNMRWGSGSARPANGTKVIIQYGGKAVVAAAGYEWGPAVSTGRTSGISAETAGYLGTDTNYALQIGFAVDQNIQGEDNGYGPINCNGGGGGGGSSPTLGDGVLDVPAIDESEHGLVGQCNRAAAGMAYLYRTHKDVYPGVGAWLAGISGSTSGILAKVGTGVTDTGSHAEEHGRCASSDNWQQIRNQVVNNKNPVVLAIGPRHYITVVGFKGNNVYVNDGSHYVGTPTTGNKVKARVVSINWLNNHLHHSESGCRYLYANP